MSDNAFRFLVANDAGETSQEWRVWTEGNELYVGPRSAAHEYKASFHSSGQCQVGISSEIRKSLVSEPAWTGKSRLFSTWTLDKVDIDSPRQDLLELLIPDSYLDVVKPEITPAGRILRGDPGQITSVALIRTHFCRCHAHIYRTWILRALPFPTRQCLHDTRAPTLSNRVTGIP